MTPRRRSGSPAVLPGLTGIPVHRRLLFSVARDCNDLDSFGQVDQPDAHGLPLGAADVTCHRTQYAAITGDCVQLVVRLNDESADQSAPGRDDPCGENTLATSVLSGVLAELGALGEAAGGGDQKDLR